MCRSAQARRPASLARPASTAKPATPHLASAATLLATSTTVILPAGAFTFGHTATITAKTNLANPSGKVTFYDGTSVLGISAITSGQATLITPFLGAGDRNVTARYDGDSADAASKSSAVLFRVNVPPTEGLSASATASVGSGPVAVIVADFTSDGIEDLAIANAGESSVSVLRGLGNGSFASEVRTQSGTNPFGLVPGDFNSDGTTDLIVVNNGDSTVSLLIGKGDGSFQTPVTYNVGNNPVAIASADFNNDGKPDVAVCNFDDNTVIILLGNGDGTLRWSATAQTGMGPDALVAGEFNGDGKTDLAVANADNTISVLLGNGDGTFVSGSTFPAGLNPLSISAGDLNGDGYIDLVTANSGDPITAAGGGVAAFIGNGDGTFQTAVLSDTSDTPEAVALGDINGDSKLDAVVASPMTVNVLLGNADGTFQAPQPYAATSPVAVAIGEFNGDGSPDLAVVNTVEANAAVFVGKPVAPISIGSSSMGFLDEADCHFISGWAWDPAQPNTSVMVDILDNGALFTTVLASTLRPDLVGPTGNGNHGFSMPTPAGLRDGNLHLVTVRLTGTSLLLHGSGRFACLSASAGGFVDSASCTSISGWAWDPARPNSPVSVDILDNGALLTTLLASNLRPDLVNAAGNGLHGFSTATPLSVLDGRLHVLAAVLSGTATLLNLPASHTCDFTPATLQGNVDNPANGASVTGTASISGWLLSSNTAINAVNVYVDGILFGPVNNAPNARPDVCNVAVPQWASSPNCPNVGFTYTLNASHLAPGPHVIQFQATGTGGIAIPGSIQVAIMIPGVAAILQGSVDMPANGAIVNGVTAFSGWALSSNTSVIAVNAYIDGNLVGPVTSRSVSRPDVCNAAASPQWASSPNCPNVGFTDSLDTSHLAGGSHTVQFEAVGAGNIAISGSVEVNIVTPPNGLLGNIDTPVNGASVNGVTQVNGWLLSPNTDVISVNAYVDGTLVGAVGNHSVARPDVCNAVVSTVWASSPNCPNVGFSYSLDTTHLSAGSHTVQVQAFGTGGVAIPGALQVNLVTH